MNNSKILKEFPKMRFMNTSQTLISVGSAMGSINSSEVDLGIMSGRVGVGIAS